MSPLAPLVIALMAAATQQPASTTQPPFRSGVQAVEVDVRVIGKDGRFVTDLTTADFELSEDGVPQKIESVVLIGAPQRSAELSSSSSMSSSAAQPRAVWLFVFDTTHLTNGSLQRTRDAVVTFVAEKFHEGDLGGVVVDGRLANNRLTSDREELRKAAAEVKMTGDLRSRQLELREWPRLRDEFEAGRIVRNDTEAIRTAVARACSDDPDSCRATPPDVQVREKAQRIVTEYRAATLQTLSVVDALSKGLARIAGPKTIVFLSEGFILQDQESELRQAAGQAARAGAHFYSVDARGLNKGTNADLIDQKVVDNPAGAGARFDMQEDGTNSLAIDTGGFAIRNENNFGRALDAIQRDAGLYYVVSYAATNEKFDGKYRAIAVKVKRPDVKVRARRGYLAIAPARMLSAVPLAAPAAVPEMTVVPASLETAGVPVVLTTPGSAAAAVSGSEPAVSNSVRARVTAGKIALSGGATIANNGAAEAGWAAYERGDVEAAARELTKAAAAPDAQAWVHYVLGMSHLALQRYRDASESWERVRRMAPQFEPVYFNLADAYLGQKEEGTAIKVLRDAEQRWPADAEIANAIGVIQVRRGALDSAIESFTHATTLSPGDALGYFNLGRAHQMRLMKRQRYNPQTERWIGGDEDKRKAIANFEKYVELGGPYVEQAKDALKALGWS